MENVAYLNRSKNRGYWTVKQYPSGDFTVGKNQPPKKDNGDHPLHGISSHETFYGTTKVSVPARPVHKEVFPEILERIALDFERAGNTNLADRFANRYAYEVLNPGVSENQDNFTPAPLGLSDATNCHKSPPRIVKKSAKRGSKGVSSYGKRMIKSLCFVMERKYSKNCLSFLTATVPAFASATDLDLICQSWSQIVRKFVQEIKRSLIRRGYPDDMVWITEIQEDRYRDRGEIAPHLHLVMVGKHHRYQKGYAIEKSEVRALWERILSNLLGRKVTCIAATRVERPRKSLQGEFGSYLSKGGEIIKEILEKGDGHLLPSSYWGGTDDLKNEVKREIKVLYGSDAQKFVDSLSDLHQAGLIYFKPIMWQIPETGREIAIGFVGWIRDIGVVCEFLDVA